MVLLQNILPLFCFSTWASAATKDWNCHARCIHWKL